MKFLIRALRLNHQLDQIVIKKLTQQNRELRNRIYKLERLNSQLHYALNRDTTLSKNYSCVICNGQAEIIANLLGGTTGSVCKQCAKVYGEN